jgi:hypothetical protein
MMASKLQPETIVSVQVADFSQVTTVFHVFSYHFSAISNWFLAGCGIITVYLNRARRKKCDYKQNQPRTCRDGHEHGGWTRMHPDGHEPRYNAIGAGCTNSHEPSQQCNRKIAKNMKGTAGLISEANEENEVKRSDG